jgi:surfeit locus 1 family protein
MIKRLPLLPTLLVLIAVGIMIRLGFWQLDRMGQKDAQIATYAAASRLDGVIVDPAFAKLDEALVYRRVSFTCPKVTGWRTTAGRNAQDREGIIQVARCEWTGADGTAQAVEVEAGWANNPAAPGWTGGAVTGVYVSGGLLGYKVVADPPLAGLAAIAAPDPNDLPNNHWSYAIQWFLFALVALVIYGIALRKRLAVKGAEG